MSRVLTFPDMAEKKTEQFDATPRNRSIELPQTLWDLIDEEADECGRSGVKQIRQILFYYFNLDTPEVRTADVDRARMLAGSQRTKRKAS